MLPILLALACAAPEPAADPDLTCNPVAGTHCMLPFPSTFFMREDDTTATGWRVALTEAGLPTNIDDVTMDPTWWNEKDGFSTQSTLFALLPDIDVDALVGTDAIGASLEAGSTTVLLDAETGERVPHYAELEVQARPLERGVLLIRPAVPLEHARRYVVGISGLVDTAGAAIEPPEGFSILRDGEDTDDGALEHQRDHYEDAIFPILKDAGIAREALQLAWDLITVSEESSLGRIDWMLDDAIARLGDVGPDYTIDEIKEDDCDAGAKIGRTITGTFQAPLYLTEWAPGSRLTRDEEGMPYHNGEVGVPFTVRVACSLIEEPRAGTVVQFGHGVLGDQHEVSPGFLDTLADANGWVLFAVDWTGMKGVDAAPIAMSLIQGPSDLVMIPERLMQGFVEGFAAGRMVTGGLAGDEALQVDGISLVDPSTIHFYGLSQGSILGGGYATMNPDIERAALVGGGMGFSSLVTRSQNFEPFLMILGVGYEDWVDISLVLGMLQHLWDPGESAGWAHRLGQDTEYLIQVAIGDESVPTLAGELFARAAGAVLLNPPTREVWGLDLVEGPISGSALVEFDYGHEDSETAVSSGADVHGKTPNSSAGQAQISQFFDEGVIENHCDGACDPD